MSKLKLDVVKELVPKNYKRLINQDIIDTINKLAEDPQYGEQLTEDYITYANVLSHNANWSLDKYLNAIKYFSLINQQMTQVDAYCTVFPDRLKARYLKGESKADMTGEASRYNSSALVNKIREQAVVPFNLVNQAARQKAFNQLVTLSTTAKSEMVRYKALDSIITHTAPPEKPYELHVDIEGSLADSINELRSATEALVVEQLKSIEAGKAVKSLVEGDIIDVEEVPDE